MINLPNTVKKEPSGISDPDIRKNIEGHRKAAMHYEAAAKLHLEAAMHHENGNHLDANKSSAQAHEHHYLASEAQHGDIQYPPFLSA